MSTVKIETVAWITQAPEFNKAVKAEGSAKTRQENARLSAGIVALDMGPDLYRWLQVDGNTLDLAVEVSSIPRAYVNRIAAMGRISQNVAPAAMVRESFDVDAVGAIWKVVNSSKSLKADVQTAIGAHTFETLAGLAEMVEAASKIKPAVTDGVAIGKALAALTAALDTLTDLSVSPAWDAVMVEVLEAGKDSAQAILATLAEIAEDVESEDVESEDVAA